MALAGGGGRAFVPPADGPLPAKRVNSRRKPLDRVEGSGMKRVGCLCVLLLVLGISPGGWAGPAAEVAELARYRAQAFSERPGQATVAAVRVRSPWVKVGARGMIMDQHVSKVPGTPWLRRAARLAGPGASPGPRGVFRPPVARIRRPYPRDAIPSARRRLDCRPGRHDDEWGAFSVSSNRWNELPELAGSPKPARPKRAFCARRPPPSQPPIWVRGGCIPVHRFAMVGDVNPPKSVPGVFA